MWHSWNHLRSSAHSAFSQPKMLKIIRNNTDAVQLFMILFHEGKEEGGRVLKKPFLCKNRKQVLFGESSNDLVHPGEADRVVWSCTLQMKGQCESNINVRFPFMYSQKWNCAAFLFPKQNYIVLFPNSYTHISVRDLYISGSMWTDPGNI